MIDRDSTIVRRLVAATLAAGLLTGIVGVGLVQVYERRDLREEAAARNLAHAERTASAIDGRLDAVASQLRILAATGPVASLDPDASAELAVALRATRQLDMLVLYDASGQPVAAAASARLLDPGRLEPRPDLAASVNARPVIELDREGDHPVIALAVAVEDPPGTRAGVLVGRAPMSLVAHEVVARPTNDDRAVTIVSADGTILAHRELDRVLDRQVLPLAEMLGSVGPTFLGEGDERELVSATRLRTLPGWVLVKQSEQAVLARDRSVADGVTTVLLAVVAAIIGSVVVAGRRLLRPLGPLADAVERLREDELDVRVEATGVGEARVLADGFNAMAAALEERRRQLEDAEREARASEQRLRVMVEGVEDYAIVLLDGDGSVRSWNTGARRLLGYDAEEAVGRGLATFLDPESPPPDPVAAAARDGRGEAEGWCRRTDGSRLWVRIVVNALHDESGDPYGYAVILHDLTDRRAAEEAMREALRREREAADELRHAAELKDEFLAIATHEIRTPLSAVLGAGSMLAEDWDDLDDAERVELRRMVDRHAQDMRLVVDRLLDFTRLQAGRVRIEESSFDLRGELESHTKLLRRHLDEHVVSVDAPSVDVRTDRELLRHVVTNLLTNAAKFSPSGSRIEVRGDVHDGELTVAVADKGIGIPPDEHDAIFELFRRSSNGMNAARGTGVGLAIVKRYVDLVGGRVEVESTPGTGSVFTVRIPVTTRTTEDSRVS